jgi:hypothetical protein
MAAQSRADGIEVYVRTRLCEVFLTLDDPTPIPTAEEVAAATAPVIVRLRVQTVQTTPSKKGSDRKV